MLAYVHEGFDHLSCINPVWRHTPVIRALGRGGGKEGETSELITKYHRN